MLKRTGENLEKLRQLVEYCKQGSVTARFLSKQMSLSLRETYRYLAMAKAEGSIKQFKRGIYLSSDLLSSNHSVNMWVSQSQQQNKTRQDLSLVIGSSEITKEPKKVQSNSGGTTMLLRDTVTLVLDTAGFDYCEHDVRCAQNILRSASWDYITPGNVEQLVTETWRRYYIQEVSTEIEYPVNYFCGIFKRVLSRKKRLTDRGREQYILAQYAAMAAGAEETAVSVGITAPESPETGFEAFDHINTHKDSSEPPKPQRSVSAEWLAVETLLKEMVEAKSAYRVAEETIQTVVCNMVDDALYVERAELALQYLSANDPVGAAYFVANLCNRALVRDIVRKNYMRYLNYGMDGRQTSITITATSSATISSRDKPKQDPRYGAFYELFPDA